MKLLLSVQHMKIRGAKMIQDNLDRFDLYDLEIEKDAEYYNRYGTDRCRLGRKDECLLEMEDNEDDII